MVKGKERNDLAFLFGFFAWNKRRGGNSAGGIFLPTVPILLFLFILGENEGRERERERERERFYFYFLIL
jgi:hypothetical protein